MSLPPFVLARVAVTDVRRLSPSYVRLVFAGEALADVGVDGPWYDQRIKLVLPPSSGVLPDLNGTDADWYASWSALPEHERGAMRTYSVRDLEGTGADTRLVVDVVLHLDPDASGPASTWASQAEVGDQVLVVAPRRGQPSGGIEFAPGDATRLLLAADETAVPALSRILADLPADARGAAFCEVPDVADVLCLTTPPGIDVRWLPRHGAEVGRELIPHVLAHLGAPGAVPALGVVADDEDVDAVWETPRYPAAGHELSTTGGGIPGLYAWIAGESGMVTTLRRHLVRDLGVDRNQVAFMGYWRKGVAARS